MKKTKEDLIQLIKDKVGEINSLISELEKEVLEPEQLESQKQKVRQTPKTVDWSEIK